LSSIIVTGIAPPRRKAILSWLDDHFQGRVEEAIAECKLAIELDPDFGNPYQRIGAY